MTGATEALPFGLGPVQVILLGTITGVGGAMLRDVLLRQVPTVLREGLYAVPAQLGAVVLVIAQQGQHELNLPGAGRGPVRGRAPRRPEVGGDAPQRIGRERPVARWASCHPLHQSSKVWMWFRPWLEDFYRHLHQHPERSHAEHSTAAAVAARLGGFGYQVFKGIGGTGVVGVLRNGAGQTVLLRADMDALPVEQQTGLPYASTATAQDGDGNEVAVMHACGHDVHVTCLLGLPLCSQAPSRTGGAGASISLGVIAQWRSAGEVM